MRKKSHCYYSQWTLDVHISIAKAMRIIRKEKNMNKLFTKIATLSVGLFMAIGVGVAVGSKNAKVANADGSVTFTAGTDTSSTTSITKDSVTVSVTSGTLSRTDNYRCYANNTMTISVSSGSLSSIEFTFSGTNTGGWDTSYTSLVGASWTSPSASGQARITKIVVEYTSSSDVLNSISIGGSMSKTSYMVNDDWNPAGFTVTANYQNAGAVDVTDNPDLSWSYSPTNASSTSVTSVTATASFGGKSATSSAQSVTVTEGVTYDLSKISGFSSWTNSYTTHNVTSVDVGASTAATMAFSITNKQGSGVGSTYPCIGAKTASELECLTFTLTQSGKKITSVDIVFVARYTTTYPSFYLHKGSGIASTPLKTLTMSGEQASEHTLSVSNLNDTVFTVGYNAHQTGSNGATGIKSISIGLADQASFGTLDHISVSALPNVVYHVGETYDSTGFAVTAYDGSDESTANFKDVTSSVVTDLDSPVPFTDSDVPGFDCSVSYSGDGGSDSTSFHVYVYALAEYELVTEELTDWSGQYLIVGTNYNSDLVAMNGGLANPDVPDGYKVVSDSANVIETGQELEWTVAKVSGGYSIQGKSGKYIGSLTTASNGMLVSETPLVNTISYSTDAATIAGTNGYNLKIYNETATSRFRYYSSGTVQLYKLKTSDRADEYAQTFLGAITCDASGEEEPSFTIKEGSTYWSWSLLSEEYDTLTPVEKEQFRLGAASTTGDNIAQALAKYDYIVGKYNKGLGMTEKYPDFMLRDPDPISKSSVMPFGSETEANNTAIIVIVSISAISVLSIAVLLTLKKRKLR